VGSERRERFLKLERARPDDPAPADPVPSSAAGRFQPPPERPLETAEVRADAQPFTRCASCRMDSSVHEPTCPRCGAPLDTPEQRGFNEKLWAERQAEAEAERKDAEARREAQTRDAFDVERARRELGEQLARRERERVDEALPDGPFGNGPIGHRESVGMRLLQFIPGTGWRIAAAVALIGLPLLLLVVGNAMVRLLAMGILFGVLSIFSPRRGRNRRW